MTKRRAKEYRDPPFLYGQFVIFCILFILVIFVLLGFVVYSIYYAFSRSTLTNTNMMSGDDIASQPLLLPESQTYVGVTLPSVSIQPVVQEPLETTTFSPSPSPEPVLQPSPLGESEIPQAPNAPPLGGYSGRHHATFDSFSPRHFVMINGSQGALLTQTRKDSILGAQNYFHDN